MIASKRTMLQSTKRHAMHHSHLCTMYTLLHVHTAVKPSFILRLVKSNCSTE